MPASRFPTQANSTSSSSIPHTSQSASVSKQQAASWLESHGYRITQARVIMIQILLAAHSPITLQYLEQLASTHTTLNFTTAYRFLKELESKGLLQFHIWHNGERRFELRTSPPHPKIHPEHGHHHYVICTQCQSTFPIPHTSLIVNLQKKIEEQLGFTDLSHILEFFGICPKCLHK